MNVSMEAREGQESDVFSSLRLILLLSGPPEHCGGGPEQRGSNTRLPRRKLHSDRQDRECSVVT